MPGVRIQGRSRAAGRGPGPSSFQEALQSGMAGGAGMPSIGADPFAGISDTQRQAMFGSPSYQQGGWAGPAQQQLARQIADAMRAWRSGIHNPQSVQIAIQAAAMLGAQGALTPELRSGVNAMWGATGVNMPDQLIPHRNLPVPYISPSYAFGGGGGGGGGAAIPMGYSPSPSWPHVMRGDPVLDFLRSIDTSEKHLVRIESDRRDFERTALVRSGGALTAGPDVEYLGRRPYRAWDARTFDTGYPDTSQRRITGRGQFRLGWGGGRGGGGGGGFGGGAGPRPGGADEPFDEVEAGVAAGIAAKAGKASAMLLAAYEIIKLPVSIAHAVASASSAADPARQLRYSAYAMGRAGGFSGAGLESEFYSGPGGVPAPWMEQLGLGPTEAMAPVKGYGIAPRSVRGGVGIARALGGLQMYNPGLSGLPDGMAAASAANAAKYGLLPGIGSTGLLSGGDTYNSRGSEGVAAAYPIERFGKQLSDILAPAVTMGLNRAEILRSIDASVAASARGGSASGASYGDTAGWMSRFYGMPGGRTGELGAATLTGMASSAAKIGTDPAATSIFSYWTQRLHGEDDIRTLFSKKPGGDAAFTRYAASPAGRALLSRYVKQRSENDPLAAITLGNIVSDSALMPLGVYADMFANNPMISALGSTTGPMAVGYLTNTPQSVYAGMQMDQRLGAMMPAFSAASARTGVPLGIITGISQSESGFDPTLENKDVDPKTGLRISHAFGLMQLQPGTAAAMIKELGLPTNTDWHDPKVNALLGAQYYKDMLALSGGDPLAALEMYHLGPAGYASAKGSPGGIPLSVVNMAKVELAASQNVNRYAADAMPPRESMSHSIPESVLKQQADAAHIAFMGPTTMLGALGLLTDALRAMYSATEGMSAALSSPSSNPTAH
jgi:transglycosylase-like protein with SLT domain